MEKKNKENLIEYKKIKKIYDEETKLYVDEKEVYLTKQKELNKINNLLIDLSVQKDIEANNVKKFKELQKEYDVYELIISVFDDGMVNDILKNKIFPAIEAQTNEILKNVCNYKIRLQCSSRGITLEKVRSDGHVINIDTLSGCEYIILNIAFRLALIKYNRFITTDFIFIDEAFQFCDQDNIQNVSTIFDYIRENCSFGLVISHDERIIQLYDTSMKVKNDGKKSKVMYV